MREPLLGLSVPGTLVKFEDYFDSGYRDEEKIVILQQVFDDVEQQRNLTNTAALFVANAGVRLICVEGAEERIHANPRNPTHEYLVRRTPNSVSAGVLNLCDSGHGEIEVWGVDHLDLKQRSEQARSDVHSDRIEPVFDEVRRLLDRARKRWYPADLARLRSALILVGTGREPEITRTLQLARRASARAGLDLHAYPSIRSLADISELGRRLDAERARREWLTFQARILEALDGWFIAMPPNRVRILPEKAAPFLDYWMNVCRISDYEFVEMITRLGQTAVYQSLRDWLLLSYTYKTLENKDDGELGGSLHNEELLRFALRVGIPFFDLSWYRNFVVLCRLRQAVEPVRAGREVTACGRAIAETIGTLEALKLFEVEEELHDIYLALRLEMGPAEAAIREFREGKLRACVEELGALANSSLSARVLIDVQTLDADALRAAEVMQHSRDRGMHMAQRTLDLMRGSGEDRALLVVGGFHPRAIVRALEDEARVSWSILSPRFDSGEYLKSHR